jgi:hypothetical protein
MELPFAARYPAPGGKALVQTGSSPLDENTWLKGNDAIAMARYLLEIGSKRKLRLLACAVAQRCGVNMTPRASKVLEAARHYADDPAGYSAMLAARHALERTHTHWEDEVYNEVPEQDFWARSTGYADVRAAIQATLCCRFWTEEPGPPECRAELMYEIFGNPFCSHAIDPLWLSANDHAVRRLACSIYREQDFALMPMLADALEEAGCPDGALLEHLRSPGQHTRGCWALDLILGDRPQLALPLEEMLQLEEPAAPRILPHTGWLATLAEGTKIPEALETFVPGVLPREGREVIVSQEISLPQLEDHPEVVAVQEVFYFTEADGVKQPASIGKGRLDQGPSGWVLLFSKREEAMEALTSVYAPARILKALRSRGQCEARRLARAAWEGDRISLRILVNLLEESGHKNAPILRKVVGGTSRSQRVLDGRLHDAELNQVRERLSKEACPGCNHHHSTEVFRVQKQGSNKDRLFARCSACGHFAWLSEAPRNPSSRSDDPEVDVIQSSAGRCPRCGKPRQALRVRKEGPNRGRIFLCCSDRACNHFQWASPAPGPDTSQEQGSLCEKCGKPTELRQVRKPGPNQGKHFRKCDHCGAFRWVQPPPAPQGSGL